LVINVGTKAPHEILMSISSTFLVRIFHTNVFCAAFFYFHVTREKLPKRLLYEKVALKTLMKLPPGGQICRHQPFCAGSFLSRHASLIITPMHFDKKGLRGDHIK